MNCLSCGAPVTNGLALCETCRAAVVIDLEFLPVYFRNLARWKPGRAGSRAVPGSREPVSPGGQAEDKVSRLLDEAGAELTGWARCLAEDRPGHLARVVERVLTFEEGRCFALLCALFDRHLDSVATIGWVGAFAHSVHHHEGALRRVTEAAVPGWYAGTCATCGSPTYVVPGLTWVTCRFCGATTAARDRLDIVLSEARDWLAPPMRLAEAIVALVDTELSVPRLHKRISKWGERGLITVVRRRDADGDETGPKRYRLGETLDRVFDEGSTRLTETAIEAAS